MISRRDLIKQAAKGGVCLLVPAAAMKALAHQGAAGEAKPHLKHWAFLVDTTKCAGCGLCVAACKRENEVPYDANASRTWVERYVVTKDGNVHADTPRAGRDGYTTDQVDLGMGRHETIKAEDIGKAFFVPKLCNHCMNPPCAQVCPVGATYKTADGVVLVDRKTCIGCGYCIMACPYGARFFHPVYKTAEKCTWCYHRISKGMKPACVEACPFGARAIGDLNDPEDPVTQTVQSERVGVLKDEYGCKPQVFYIGLSKEVR